MVTRRPQSNRDRTTLSWPRAPCLPGLFVCLPHLCATWTTQHNAESSLCFHQRPSQHAIIIIGNNKSPIHRTFNNSARGNSCSYRGRTERNASMLLPLLFSGGSPHVDGLAGGGWFSLRESFEKFACVWRCSIEKIFRVPQKPCVSVRISNSGLRFGPCNNYPRTIQHWGFISSDRMHSI